MKIYMFLHVLIAVILGYLYFSNLYIRYVKQIFLFIIFIVLLNIVFTLFKKRSKQYFGMSSEGGADLEFFRSKNPLLFWVGIISIVLAGLLLFMSLFFQIDMRIIWLISLILVASMVFLWFSAFLKSLKKLKNRKS